MAAIWPRVRRYVAVRSLPSWPPRGAPPKIKPARTSSASPAASTRTRIAEIPNLRRSTFTRSSDASTQSGSDLAPALIRSDLSFASMYGFAPAVNQVVFRPDQCEIGDGARCRPCRGTRQHEPAPGLAGHWNWRKEINKYLIIQWIAKSSTAPPRVLFKIDQMQDTQVQDAEARENHPPTSSGRRLTDAVPPAILVFAIFFVFYRLRLQRHSVTNSGRQG